MFLSQAALKSLSIVTKSFPLPKTTKPEINSSTYLADQFLSQEQKKEQEEKRKMKEGCAENCSCPKRQLPPPAPTLLPFPVNDTEEDRQKVKAHICRFYASSA